jgi:hypothetical protein
MKKLLLLSLVIFSVILAPMSNVFAEGAKSISFQGVLLDSEGNPLNDVLPVRFELYDAQYGGNQLWGETQTVEFEDGYFNVYLGTENPLDLEFKSEYFLQITVADGTPYDRTPLSYSPYAFSSETAKLADFAQDIPDGSVTLAKLADEVKIITGDVEGTLPELYLAEGAVKRNIKPGDIESWMLSKNVSLPPSGPASGDLTGTYPDPKIADEAVTTRTIETGAVTWSKLQTPLNTTPGTILGWDGTKWVETDVPTWEEGRVKDIISGRGLYTEDDGNGFLNVGIADDGIVSSMILDGEVMTDDIADMAVVNAKLAADAVTTDKIMDGEVMTDDIADMNVTNVKLAADAVTTDKILDGEVMTDDIANYNVTNMKLDTNAVTTDKIMDGQVMTDDIADMNVTNAKLAADAITTDKIMDGEVMNADIAADAITTDKIMDGEVMNEDIAAGAIDLTKLEDGTALGQVMYWDGTEWRFNSAAPHRDFILKWDWNADTTGMELQYQQDAMAIPFYYDEESTDGNGDPQTMLHLVKTDGNPNIEDHGMMIEVQDVDANSALKLVGSGHTNDNYHPVLDIDNVFGGSAYFGDGALSVNAELGAVSAGNTYGAKIMNNVTGSNQGNNVYGTVINNNVGNLVGSGLNAGLVINATTQDGDNSGVVMGLHVDAESQNTLVNYGAAFEAEGGLMNFGSWSTVNGSVAADAANITPAKTNIALVAYADDLDNELALYAHGNSEIEGSLEIEDNLIVRDTSFLDFLEVEEDAAGTDYIAKVTNINADGRGMLVESTSPTAFPYNWPGDPTDADDATLVVRNNATAPRIAIKTYGDIVANSSVYGSVFVANDSIVVGAPGNQVTIKAPENPGDPLQFDGDVDVTGTLTVGEDVYVDGMVMAPTGDFEILNVSQEINAGTATADFGVTTTDALTAEGYFSATAGADIFGGLVVDDVEITGYASQANAPVDDDDLTNKLYVDDADDAINDRIDEILNVGAEFAGTYDLSGTMNVSGTIQPDGGTVLANAYEPTADIEATNAEFGGDLYVEGVAGILDDGMGSYIFSVTNDYDGMGNPGVVVDADIATTGNVLNPMPPTAPLHLTNKAYVDAADSDLQDAIDAEEAARIAADDVLQANIDAEEAARIAADDVLQANIDAEEAARIAADDVLQANIDAEEAARIAADDALQANIDAEEAARIAADAALQTELDNTQTGAGLNADGTYSADGTSNYITSAASLYTADQALDAALKAEEAARMAEDATLQANIDAEEAARIAADAALQTELDNTQTGAGLNADGTYSADGTSNYITSAASLYTADQALDAALKAEEAARIAADDVLQANIDAEEAARIAADDVLQANIDAEEAARIAADDVLQANIDAEEAARIAADDVLQANIDAEEAARIAADDALQANIDAEEAARIAADDALQANIDAEEAARIAADAALQTELDNTQTGAGLNADGTYSADGTSNYITSAASLYTADQALDAALKAEEAARMAEDATLQANLDAEEAARIAADAALQTELDNTQTGAGLNADGTYSADGTANYITSAASLYTADQALDAALKAVEDDLNAITSEAPITFDGVTIGLDHDLTLDVPTATGQLGLNLANSNTWTATQEFDDGLIGTDAELSGELYVEGETGLSAADGGGYVFSVSGDYDGFGTDGATLLGDFFLIGNSHLISGDVDHFGTFNLLTDDLNVDFGNVDVDMGDINVGMGNIEVTLGNVINPMPPSDPTHLTNRAYVDAADSDLQDAIDAEAAAREAADLALQAELDATQIGAGLDADGNYVADGTANYITSAASLYTADQALDAALKTEETNRIAADDALGVRIDDEETARISGDDAINTRIDNILTVGEEFSGAYDFSGTFTVNGILQPGTGTVRANDYVATADLTANDIIGTTGEFEDLTVTQNAYIGEDGLGGSLLTVDSGTEAVSVVGEAFTSTTTQALLMSDQDFILTAGNDYTQSVINDYSLLVGNDYNSTVTGSYTVTAALGATFNNDVTIANGFNAINETVPSADEHLTNKLYVDTEIGDAISEIDATAPITYADIAGTYTIGMDYDNTNFEVNASDELDIMTGGITSNEIADATIVNDDMANPTLDVVAGNGISTSSQNIALGGTATLDVNVDNSTLEINADVIRVKASGITSNEIAEDAVGTSELADNAVYTANIANGEVKTEDISDGDVTNAKLNADVFSTSHNWGGTQTFDNVDINDGTIDATIISAESLTFDGSAPVVNGIETTATDVDDKLPTSGAVIEAVNNALASITATAPVTYDNVNYVIGMDYDGSTLDMNSTNELYVPTGGITSNEIANGTIVNEDIANATIENAKLVNNSVTVNANAGLTTDMATIALGGTANLSVNVDDATVEVNGSDNLAVMEDGITTRELATDAVITENILDANVTNAKLANSTVTITPGNGLLSDGDGTLSLGDTETYSVDVTALAGDGLVENSGVFDVNTDATLQVVSDEVGINLGNSNTWTADQTFQQLMLKTLKL